MANLYSKRTLTAAIAAHLTDKSIICKPCTLFFNEDSLRLRPAGFNILQLYFESTQFDVLPITSGKLLLIARYLNTPFYIHSVSFGTKLTLFSSEDSVMLKLCGSIDVWLDTIAK